MANDKEEKEKIMQETYSHQKASNKKKNEGDLFSFIVLCVLCFIILVLIGFLMNEKSMVSTLDWRLDDSQESNKKLAEQIKVQNQQLADKNTELIELDLEIVGYIEDKNDLYVNLTRLRELLDISITDTNYAWLNADEYDNYLEAMLFEEGNGIEGNWGPTKELCYLREYMFKEYSYKDYFFTIWKDEFYEASVEFCLEFQNISLVNSLDGIDGLIAVRYDI